MLRIWLASIGSPIWAAQLRPNCMPEEQGGRERLNHIKGILSLLLFIGTDIYRVYEQEIVHVLKKLTHAEKNTLLVRRAY